MRWTEVPAAAWRTPQELVEEGFRRGRVVMLSQAHDGLMRWLWVLVAVSLALAVAIPMWLWLPRAPSATADHETWKLFGRQPAPGDWVSGDGAYPVPLPGGRVAWLFGDSLVRRADAATRSSTAPSSSRTVTGFAPSPVAPPPSQPT